jgi:hypothetical protein
MNGQTSIPSQQSDWARCAPAQAINCKPPETRNADEETTSPALMLSVQPLSKRKSNNMHLVHHPNRHGNVYYPSFRKPTDRRAADRAAFEALTAQIVMKQHRDGTLNPGVLEALLLGVGLEP